MLCLLRKKSILSQHKTKMMTFLQPPATAAQRQEEALAISDGSLGKPSGGMVDAVGLFRWDRVGMANPFTWVTELYKENPITKTFAKYEKPWTHLRNDPASLLFGKDRRDKKKKTHFGYTPQETGTYIFVLNVEGSGRQVLGASWYGPKATISFKGLSTHLGYKAELRYNLDNSNNRLWLRGINSLLECTRIEIQVSLTTLQPIFFFPCFATTPITEMFNTGAATNFSVRPQIDTIAPIVVAPASPASVLGARMYEMRELTGDYVVVAAGKSLKVHRAVMLAKSDWLYTQAMSGVGAALDDKTQSFEAEGEALCWELIIEAAYMGAISPELMVRSTNRHLLFALEHVDYYAFTEDVEAALVGALEYTRQSMAPIFVYAWKRRNQALFDEGVFFLGENEQSPSEQWKKLCGELKRQNPELVKIIMRQTTEPDWSAKVGEWWERSMESLYTTTAQREEAKRQRVV